MHSIIWCLILRTLDSLVKFSGIVLLNNFDIRLTVIQIIGETIVSKLRMIVVKTKEMHFARLHGMLFY